MSKKSFIFTFSIFVFVFINSTGPYFNISGNLRARFALTKSIVDDQVIDITKHKNYIGYDQATVKDKVYCTHNPGFSVLMALPYLLITKPISLISNSPVTKENFIKEAWLTKTLTMAILVSLSLLPFFLILRSYFGNSSFFAPLYLFTPTLLFPYLTSPFADLASALLQFPLIYLIFEKKSELKNKHYYLIFFIIFILSLVKPTNSILAISFLVYVILNKNLIAAKIIVFSLVTFAIAQSFYNYSFDGNPFTFIVQYFNPMGQIQSPVYDPFSEVMQIFNLKKIFYLFFDPYDGLITYNCILLLVLYKLKTMNTKQLCALVSPVLLLIFFFFFRNWNLGADFGWRNGLPLIPLLLYIVITKWDNNIYVFKFFRIFGFIITFIYSIPFLYSVVINYKAIDSHQILSFYFIEMAKAPQSILSNTNFEFHGFILILLSFLFIFYSYKRFHSDEV